MAHTVPASPSRYNRRTSAEEVTDGIDLTGKTILITGVSSGLGFESMRVLATRGAHIIGLARTARSAGEACRKIVGETTAAACDLSDLDSVGRCAETVTALGKPLDVLMCNAGIMALPRLEQKYGLELQFLTNHLGHFLLLNKLLALVLEAPAGRVVMVSSMAHQHTVKGGIDFNNLGGALGYDPWKFYGQSKLANLLTSNELARRLYRSNATSNAVHPGVIDTGLGRYNSGTFSRVLTTLAKPVQREVPQGAATQCYVATHRNQRRVSGQYFADCNPAKTSAYGRDTQLARRLWEKSEQLVADYL